ncbi:MAG: class I SAM-dependent methyltransferase, partial [Planctomycetales bacterium]|nr:class I SAM-dependent methyltransferase [Planctomycetales bacterium]
MICALVLFACVVCASPAALADAPTDAAAIFEATGVQGGVVVHVGCGDGQLTAALRASDSYQVQGLDRSADNVEAARGYVQSLGKYGPISVDRLRGNQLPYVDNFVNLVVLEDAKIPLKEALRVLTPGGVAYVHRGDAWEKTAKPWPKNIDEWTHYLHGPDGNAVAHDTVVGPPKHMQWLGSPRWSRHHDRMASMSAMVSAKGRVFYIMDEGSRVSIELPSKWKLIARDAFNGTVLWKRDIPQWHSHLWPLKSGPTQLARRLVAVDDRVYVTLGINAPLSVLDAATGETLSTLEGSEGTEEIVVAGANVYALVSKEKWELEDYLPAFNT